MGCDTSQFMQHGVILCQLNTWPVMEDKLQVPFSTWGYVVLIWTLVTTSTV